MRYPIPPPESILLLMAFAFPTGFGANISALVRPKSSRSIASSLAGLVLTYGLLIGMAALVAPQHVIQFNRPSSPLFYGLGLLGGGLCLLLEYLVGVGLTSLHSGILVTRLEVHSSYAGSSNLSWQDIAMVMALVIGEEWVLRQMLVSLSLTGFGLTPGVVIALCAAFYALNHITFGPQTVLAKLASGLVYTILFFASGFAILVPILGHAAQNLALLLLTRSGGQR